MRYHPSHRNIVWTALFSIIAALFLNGCSDVSNAPAPAPGPTALTITSGSPLPSGTKGIAYSTTLAADGGNPGYTWSLKTGPGFQSLPPGLQLSTAGVISGTPTAIITTSPTFRVVDKSTPTAQSAEKQLTIAINAVPQPTISAPASLPNGIVSTAYSATLTASAGTPPYTTWSVNPPLPAGLTLTPSGPTATVTGSLAAPYNNSHTFSVTDSFSPTPQTGTRGYTLTFTNAPLLLSITTNSLPGGTVLQQNYSAMLAAIGGTPPLTWSIVSGSLPPGLQLNQNTGAITGVPTTAGTFSPTFRVQDVGTPQQSAQKLLSITISVPAAPSITTTLLPNGSFNNSYNQTLSVTGGIAPLTWGVIVGGLPNGLTLNSSNGMISGTATATGMFNFTVRVTDAIPQFDDQALSITITAPPAPNITTTSLPVGTVNAEYPPTTLTATGGAPPLTWQPVGLPFGLTFTASTATISGIPTTSGSQNVTFTVNDATAPINQTDSQVLNLTVNVALTIETISPLPAGTVGQPYAAVQLVASGGAPPYSWSITGTGAPSTAAPGLTLSSAGVIGGSGQTPTTADSFTRTYRVQDSNGAAVTKPLTLNVNAALTIDNTSPLPNGTAGQLYTPAAPLTTMTASGGTPPYSNWSVTPDLPTGLFLDDSTGAITGTPLPLITIGTTIHTFSVQDSTNLTVSKPDMSLTINP